MSVFKPRAETPDAVSVREFLERIIDERDRLYNARFKASEIAVTAAFDAQKETMAAAFLASKEAIGKAENAQTAYNVAHNDLAHKMEVQYKEMMPRPETLGLFKACEEKISTSRDTFDSKLEALRVYFEKSIEDQTKDIRILRESRSEIGGKAAAANALFGYFVGAAGVALAIIFHFYH